MIGTSVVRVDNAKNFDVLKTILAYISSDIIGIQCRSAMAKISSRCDLEYTLPHGLDGF